MDNYSGNSDAILANKLRRLIRSLDIQNSRETKMAILSQLLLSSENPAFYSSMIVSLKKSGTLNGYARETNHPSFPIENSIATVDNIPATFLESYQPVDIFAEHGTQKIYTDLIAPITVNVLHLKRGTNTVSRIISGR